MTRAIALLVTLCCCVPNVNVECPANPPPDAPKETEPPDMRSGTYQKVSGVSAANTAQQLLFPQIANANLDSVVVLRIAAIPGGGLATVQLRAEYPDGTVTDVVPATLLAMDGASNYGNIVVLMDFSTGRSLVLIGNQNTPQDWVVLDKSKRPLRLILDITAPGVGIITLADFYYVSNSV